MLLGPWSTLQTLSFLPSISHAGKILPIKGYASDFRLYYLDLKVLYRPHPSCLQYLMRGEFYLSRFMHPIGLRIWFFGYVTWTLDYSASLILLAFSISCRGEFYLSRLAHLTLLMHPIGLRIWFFGYVTWTLEYSANLILLAFSISCGGEFYLSRLAHLILRLLGPWSALQSSSFLPLVSHAENIFNKQCPFLIFPTRF